VLNDWGLENTSEQSTKLIEHLSLPGELANHPGHRLPSRRPWRQIYRKLSSDFFARKGR